MERQVTSPSTASIDRTRRSPAGARSRTPAEREQPPPAGRDAGGLVLTSVSSWTHRLTLTGELTHRTAHALEVEIERLCEEGVTDITLDLTRLDRVDPVGVAVIAFRCGLCEKRGYGFTMIRGSREVQRTFEEAGVAELLPFCDPPDTAIAATPAEGAPGGQGRGGVTPAPQGA